MARMANYLPLFSPFFFNIIFIFISGATLQPDLMLSHFVTS